MKLIGARHEYKVGTGLTRVLFAVDLLPLHTAIGSQLASHEASFAVTHTELAGAPQALSAERFEVCLAALPRCDETAREFAEQARQGQALAMGQALPLLLIVEEWDDATPEAAREAGYDDALPLDEVTPALLARALWLHAELFRKESALAAASKKFAAMTEHSSDGMVMLDGEGNILSAGPSSPRILGYGSFELIGRSHFHLLHPEDSGPTISRFLGLVQEPGGVQQTQFRIRHKDGDWHWLECIATNLLHEAGVEAVVLNCWDITDRVRTDAEIKELNVQLERQLERITALHHIDLAITGSLDMRVVLNILMNELINQLNVDAAAVLLLNTQTWSVEHAVSRGFHSDAIKKPRTQVMKTLAGRAVLERKTLHVANLNEPSHGQVLAAGLADERFTSYWVAPLVSKGQVKGIIEVYHREAMDANDEWLDFFETLANQAAIAVDNALVFEELKLFNHELTQAYDVSLEGWARALDRRNGEVSGHSAGITELAVKLGCEYGLGEEELRHIRHGALLHDMGHLGIPETILFKTEELTEAEREVVRRHPVYAYEMMAPTHHLRPALDIPYCHHERWDGSGYPRGLMGDQIPRAARIFAPVDVWIALLSDRPHRAAWTRARALAYLREQSGKLFDPVVTEKLVALLEKS